MDALWTVLVLAGVLLAGLFAGDRLRRRRRQREYDELERALAASVVTYDREVDDELDRIDGLPAAERASAADQYGRGILAKWRAFKRRRD